MRLTLPTETEDNIRRRILDLCQNHARNVVEVTRQLAVTMDNVANGKSSEAKQNYASLMKIKEENERTVEAFLNEVSSFGTLLENREDFLRLIFRMNEVTEYCGGMASRLMEIVTARWKIDRKKFQKICQLVDSVLKEILKVRETLHSLSFDASKAIEMARVVNKLDRHIDEESRKLDMELLSSKMTVAMLLFLRDLIDRAEHIADIGVDVADQIRLLALRL